jgi:hypothetical protein
VDSFLNEGKEWLARGEGKFENAACGFASFDFEETDAKPRAAGKGICLNE